MKSIKEIIAAYIAEGEAFDSSTFPRNSSYGMNFFAEPPQDWLVWVRRVKLMADEYLREESAPRVVITEGFNQGNGLRGNLDDLFDKAKANLLKGLRLFDSAVDNDVHQELKVIQAQEQEAGQVIQASKVVFIGHGGSPDWKDLRAFLHDRLSITWEEFNRESVAGKSNKERLEEMLNKCGFAFLVMTAEDEHDDKSLHARENVIHEVGLFQGRLGFSRAIVLLEEGCAEFSNISGIGQIRFPKGNIKSASEDIRMVLEREGFL